MLYKLGLQQYTRSKKRAEIQKTLPRSKERKSIYILRETSNSESPHTHSFGSLPIKAAQKHGQSHRPYSKTCHAGNNH